MKPVVAKNRPLGFVDSDIGSQIGGGPNRRLRSGVTIPEMDTPDARTAIIPMSPHPSADARRTKRYSPN